MSLLYVNINVRNGAKEMIRDIIKDDGYKIKELLRREVGVFDEGNLEEKINSNNYGIVYEDNDGIRGFSVLNVYNNILKKARMFLYLSEAYRRRGIGKELYLKSLEYCNNENISNIIIDIRTEKNDTSKFFINNGFEKWYSVTEMDYKGGKVDSDLKVVNYEDKCYEVYKNTYEDAFLELRQAIGFTPLRACDTIEELREVKDNIFMLLDGEDLIGSVKLQDNEIDDVFINEKYQGQGYGRELIKFSISYYQKRNAEKIFLGVVDWNVKGANLYKSCGFVDTKKVSTYRINLSN